MKSDEWIPNMKSACSEPDNRLGRALVMLEYSNVEKSDGRFNLVCKQPGAQPCQCDVQWPQQGQGLHGKDGSILLKFSRVPSISPNRSLSSAFGE